jgi:hypothetical protein
MDAGYFDPVFVLVVLGLALDAVDLQVCVDCHFAASKKVTERIGQLLPWRAGGVLS